MDLVRKTVTGTFKRPDGTALVGGRVQFDPQGTLADTGGLDIVVPNDTTEAITDGSGFISVELYTIDDAWWNYTCRLPNGESFEFSLFGDAVEPVDLADLIEIAASAKAITIIKASTTQLGGVRVDGVTIVIDSDGVISAVGGSERSVVSHTTGSLANGSAETFTLDIDRFCSIIKVEFSRYGRFRAYKTTAQRTADVGRAFGDRSYVGEQHGIIFDILEDQGGEPVTWIMSPDALAANGDDPAVDNIYCEFTNLGTIGTVDIDVTIES